MSSPNLTLVKPRRRGGPKYETVNPYTRKKLRKWALATRCRHCGGGIIWLWRLKGPKIPVEPYTWDGSVYYVKGVHRFHGNRCEFWRRHRPEVEVDPELVVE